MIKYCQAYYSKQDKDFVALTCENDEKGTVLCRGDLPTVFNIL